MISQLHLLASPAGIASPRVRILTAGPISGGDAQRAAERELSKPEYHRDDPDLISRVWQWLMDWLDRLPGGVIGGSATLVLAGLLLAVLIFAILRAGPIRKRARAQIGSDDDPLRPGSKGDHRRLAEQFAAQGQRAEAVREWLRAAVQTIEERGILDPRPGRTGDEIAREAGARLPHASLQLRAATEAFDLIWFGGREATDQDVSAARAAADAVRTARVDRSEVVTGEYALPR
jgi:hypothetical protein